MDQQRKVEEFSRVLALALREAFRAEPPSVTLPPEVVQLLHRAIQQASTPPPSPSPQHAPHHYVPPGISQPNVYAVERMDPNGAPQVVPATLPQLLAEIADHLQDTNDLIESMVECQEAQLGVMENRRRRRKKKRA